MSLAGKEHRLMTAELLKPLAELNAAAFDFYQRSNTPIARRFQDSAQAATAGS